jgi:hypothetical protein
MNINDISGFKLSDAIKFHNKLNPALFDGDSLFDDVKDQLLMITADFIEHLGVDNLHVKDIIIAGSNAAYTYTDHSDIDLHIIVDISKLSDDLIYKELFTAKKTIYNDEHDITVKGYDVELYVEDTNTPVKSLGVYSVLNNKWVRYPNQVVKKVDDSVAGQKFDKLRSLAQLAMNSNDYDKISTLLGTIKKYRQAGLDAHGEFSTENLAYKALRTNGIVDKLYRHKSKLHSNNLSIDEGDQITIAECSGYIPSESEKDDPRFERALSVDVRPNTMKDQAAAMGLGNIARDGRPQITSTRGKYKI